MGQEAKSWTWQEAGKEEPPTATEKHRDGLLGIALTMAENP